ncbi:hypothetical protein B0H10DRAFT_2210926 [Mycena sp. CBHHK59/15]|nr:hypothetical protein B0H10DRAFT_2210926 [Mycena sp. CBHHK59/15]
MLSVSKILLSLSFTLAALGMRQPSVERSGTVFIFEPDLGACGFTNTSDQAVGTVSSTVYKSYPGATANPNKNPICHHTMVVQVPNGQTVSVQIVDFFPENGDAGPNDVGVTKMDFVKMAPLDDGIIPNATWSIL